MSAQAYDRLREEQQLFMIAGAIIFFIVLWILDTFQVPHGYLAPNGPIIPEQHALIPTDVVDMAPLLLGLIVIGIGYIMYTHWKAGKSEERENEQKDEFLSSEHDGPLKGRSYGDEW